MQISIRETAAALPARNARREMGWGKYLLLCACFAGMGLGAVFGPFTLWMVVDGKVAVDTASR